MNRAELVRHLAEQVTRPLSDYPKPAPKPVAAQAVATELFVWFEDTTERRRDGRRGIAGLPESLLPYSSDMRVVARVYAGNHLHLLSAVRIRVFNGVGERISALYTAALSVGTVAWIGNGEQYERAWDDLYPTGPVVVLQDAPPATDCAAHPSGEAGRRA